MSRVRQDFDLELPLESLFEAPTVARFAARIAAEKAAGARGDAAPPLLPVPRRGELPLSFAQQRLLFLDVLARGDVAYNLPLGLRLSGPLDPAVLRRALARLILRHEVLRTTFRTAEGRAWQVISPEVPAEAVRLPLIDLAVLGGARRKSGPAASPARTPRAPWTSPPVRCCGRCCCGSPAEHRLVITIHHIAGDGWSWGILLGDLVELYEAEVEERPAELAELPLQYADFAVWQRGWLEDGALERQLAYWQRRLAGLPRTELPPDHPRPAVRRGRGAVMAVAFHKELVDALRRLGREEDATLFMVLLAGFCVLLRTPREPAT